MPNSGTKPKTTQNGNVHFNGYKETCHYNSHFGQKDLHTVREISQEGGT